MCSATIAGDLDAVARLDRLVDGRMSDRTVDRIKVWTTSGRIVYSDRPELIGRTYELDDSVRSLRPDGIGVAEISEPDEQENEFERNTEPTIEVYPMSRAQTGERLVFEAYFPLSAVDRQWRQLLSQMAPVGLAALVALSLVQLPLAIGLARRVRDSRQARERVLAQSVAAVELERRRLAQSLHDDVIQDLASIGVTLETVEDKVDDRVRPSIQKAGRIVRRDVGLLRDMVDALFPTLHGVAGLDESIRDLTASVSRSGIEVHLDLEPDPGLDATTTSLLYRVTREAVVNVSKHAQATHLYVTFHTTDDEAVLTVTDDGVGFEAAVRQHGHVGLDLVRQTVAEAGGHVDVVSVLGSGTRVVARLPL